MKHIFGFLFAMFAIVVAAKAIVWSALVVWGFVGGSIAFLILLPMVLASAGVFGAVARTDSRREAQWKRRAAWRGW